MKQDYICPWMLHLARHLRLTNWRAEVEGTGHACLTQEMRRSKDGMVQWMRARRHSLQIVMLCIDKHRTCEVCDWFFNPFFIPKVFHPEQNMDRNPEEMKFQATMLW